MRRFGIPVLVSRREVAPLAHGKLIHEPSDIPAAPHRPRPLLRRQRPAVGVLLPQRLRLRRGRLRRPGDQDASTRPATSCARATSPSSSPRRSAPTTPRASASSCTATACRTSPWKWTTCRAPTRRHRGAAPSASSPPTLLEDEHGVYEYATIRAYGDTTHTFVNRDRYRGVFAPGYKPLDPDRYSPRTFQPVGLQGDRPHRRQRRGRQDGRVGRASTSTCWASRSWSASTTRTSARSTRR